MLDKGFYRALYCSIITRLLENEDWYVVGLKYTYIEPVKYASFTWNKSWIMPIAYKKISYHLESACTLSKGCRRCGSDT